jgi:hypothetical protein
VLARGPNSLELRADPTGLAPERLLVFEVRGSINAFATAIRNVNGLELIDEEELDGDEDDVHPVAYLLVPDMAALRNLESLWRRWQNNQLVWGETSWGAVFNQLRDLRAWGPSDRIERTDAGFLAATIEERADQDLVRLEIELVYRNDDNVANEHEANVQTSLVARGGRVVSRARIGDIAYHAILADVPVWAVREIIEQRLDGIAGLEPIMHIRPQSSATTIEISDAREPGPESAMPERLGEPILALLDGVPVASHRLLALHTDLDDPFGLEPNALVASRSHGTAMASLIVYGDRNRNEPSLPRQIHILPVMGDNDDFPSDRLVVDLIYLAVMRLREFRPSVLIINMSLGNRYRPFHGQLSPWARLIDRLASRFGLLFIVSAGNAAGEIGLAPFATSMAYVAAEPHHRAAAMITALHGFMAERRLFSPAETLNGITVGGYNKDSVPPDDRALAGTLIDPYPAHDAANPSSALGPGFARAGGPRSSACPCPAGTRVARRRTEGCCSAVWRSGESRWLYQRD